MEWVTTTAKTLPEAIDLALDNLGVDEAEAEIVVLEEPKQGLFGRMRGAARVEARVKPKAIRPKVERGRPRRSKSNDNGRGSGRRSGRGSDGRRRNKGSRSGGNAPSGRSSDNTKGKGGGQSSGKQRQPAKAGGGSGTGGSGKQRQTAAADREEQEANGKSSGSSRSRRGRGRGRSGGEAEGKRGGETAVKSESTEARENRGRRSGRSKSAESRAEANSTSSTRSRPNDHEQDKKEETPVEEVAEHLRSFLGGLTEAFGLEGGVDIDDSEADVLVATVEGQHGLMVGPKGRTLDAIQELARVSSQRAAPSNIRIRVDVGGYRRQRAAALGEFARKAADKAVDNACEVALEPMSPADRKSVHDSLVEDPRVETRSVGTEPRRKVIIIPVEDTPSTTDDADDSEDSEYVVASGEEE